MKDKVERIDKALSEIMKFTTSQVKMATLMLAQVDQEVRGYAEEEGDDYSSDELGDEEAAEQRRLTGNDGV